MRGARGSVAGATALVCAVGGLAGCGGGPRQDAHEPSGTFKVQVVRASFPTRQSIAQATRLKIRVHNADRRPLPDVAVTVETRTSRGGAAQAFSSDIQDSNVSDPSRPIWIVDQGPTGGDTSATNTWALGPLKPGATREFVWKLTAVKPGTYTVAYRVSPGLTGKARPARGRYRGEFRVRISATPPDASVDDNGNVVTKPASSALPATGDG